MGAWTSRSVCSSGRHIRQVLHGGDESISVTGNGDDEIVLVGTLAERAPQRRNLTRQVVLVDGRVRPHAVQELVFADDVVSMLEQHDEHVEGLRRDRDETTIPPQLPLEGIHDERTEGIPTVPGRAFQFGVAHVAPVTSGLLRT